MRRFEFDENEVKELIDRVVHRTMSMDFTWNWSCGVAYYGICKAWEVTRKQEYIDFLVKWVDEYLELGLPPLMVNACAMGHTMLTLHEATGDSRYLDLAVKKAEYLRNDAIRFGEGVFQHTVSSKNDFPEQAWADTLFMAAYFLLRLGYKVDNKAYIEDALNQYYWHEEYLQDMKTNLFYHAWDNVRQDHLSAIYWGRANAWASYTMAQASKMLNPFMPMWMQIGGALSDQLSALVRLQSQEGLWRTVLDDDTSYLETSASAGIAAALVVKGHPLHEQAIAKAYEGIVAQIDDDGSVRKVSAGTAVMYSAEDYKAISTKRIQGWGQGLTLAFLVSLLQRQGE
ncbi:glycoside hydrolase family 88/105 protein [Paenibacillus puerhi]|uniref:glycoside hydrolase family 88/105 protein n=1 Tax=Paenibacillus puerhi TaxID=2692622 RepID=UPI00135AB9A2|nr:glycoside hydrolase family 88 protein [Paenibacillus puerhi]